MKTNLTEVFAIFLALAKRRAEIINQCIILHYVRNMAHRFAAHTHTSMRRSLSFSVGVFIFHTIKWNIRDDDGDDDLVA